MANTSTRVSRPEEEGVKRLVAMAGERDSGETCRLTLLFGVDLSERGSHPLWGDLQVSCESRSFVSFLHVQPLQNLCV